MSHVPRNNNFYFYWVNNSNTAGHVVNSSLIKSNSIINITLTFNGVGGTDQSVLYDNTKVYINGVEYAHSGGGGAGAGSTQRLTVGSEYYKFAGNIYSFFYYNRVLSSVEILQNYNATKGRFGL